MTATVTVSKEVPTRHFANVLDVQIPGPDEVHGVNRSRDAIGGSYGVGWYSHFRDRTTGEIYKVHQSDGVYGGKGAYRNVDEQWKYDVYKMLVDRFKLFSQLDGGAITISRNERIAIQGFTHATLLETTEGARDGKQSDEGLEGGLVGHYHGIPVICDLKQEEVLLPPK